WADRASGDRLRLVIATVSAPRARAASRTATMLGDWPDWEIPIVTVRDDRGRPPSRVMTDGAASATGRPRRASSRYLPYTAALSELPRAARETATGSLRRRRAASALIRGHSRSSSRAVTSGASRISRSMKGARSGIPGLRDFHQLGAPGPAWRRVL